MSISRQIIVSEIRSPVMLRKLHTNPSKFFGVDPPKKLEWFVWSHRLGVGGNFPAGNQAHIFSLQLTFCSLINMVIMRDSRQSVSFKSPSLFSSSRSKSVRQILLLYRACQSVQLVQKKGSHSHKICKNQQIRIYTFAYTVGSYINGN